METLYQLTEQMSALESLLEDNGGELTPDIEALWQETGESLTRKVDNYNALIIKLKYYSLNLDAEIKRLQALKNTADNSRKNIKEHIKSVMEQFGIDKLEGAYCKVSLVSSIATEVDEEVALAPYLSGLESLKLPEWVVVDLRISKKALKEIYKDKDVTPAGVSFVKNKSLRIK